MTDLRLEQAIEYYATKLTALEDLRAKQLEADTEENPIEATILDVLIARDLVENQLIRKRSTSADKFKRISQLDQQVKDQEVFIAEHADLEKWRKMLKPQPESWWWFAKVSTHPLDRFDWTWNGLSLLSLTISFALFTSIAPRFFIGGPDPVGATVIAGQSIIGLLGARGSFTSTGQKTIETILEKVKIPKYWHKEISCVLALLILGFSAGLYKSLPLISILYSSWASEDADRGHLGDAQTKYSRAILLDPNNVNARYGLGDLYERMRMPERARTEYQIAAAQGGVSSAYSNLGRLEILDKKYSMATSLLNDGLKRLEEDLPSSKYLNERKYTEYALRKNLGWARLGQERYDDAYQQLEKAQKLYSEISTQFKEIQKMPLPLEQAATYCLTAQVFEAENKKKEAQKRWNKCRQLVQERFKDEEPEKSVGNKFSIDEDNWLNQAIKCLKIEYVKKQCVEKK